MKLLLRFLLFPALILLLAACSQSPLNPTETTTDRSSHPDTEETPTDDNLYNEPFLDSYYNPVIKTNAVNAWQNYGIGDPFVMRWNGRYYLYCSSKDGIGGIQCWTSGNLVDWHYHGLCATEALTESAYAPEVVYYNGSFYMYTSPAGNGHYVLKSDSPTGPFLAVTDNFGLSIDGNVFIDDDGSWHFYTAGYKGIMAYPMSAPDRIDAENGIKTNTSMNGWTEGSMILKYNGIYYMTYCGNHVWCPGYRINYATSTKSPLDFTPAQNNPLLISTDRSSVMGIGHSSTVLSPDLDSYYIVYHSYKTVPQRSMNIDRIVLNGSLMEVLGPTTTKQEAPAMPVLYSYFETEDDLTGWTVTNGNILESKLTLTEGGAVVSHTKLSDRYTVEANLLSLTGQAGILFGHTDDNNKGTAIYDANSHTLTVTLTVNGKTTTYTESIKASFGETLRNDALILFTIRKYGSTFVFLVNNRQVLTCESALGGGAIGVLSPKGTATLGFVGASNEAMQSSVKNIRKPIEGNLPAFSCMEEDLALVKYSGANYVTVSEGETYRYRTNVAKTSPYDLTVTYRSKGDCELVILQDNTEVGRITLSKSSTTAYGLLRNVQLTKGIGTIRIAVASGSADILSYQFHLNKKVTPIRYDFSTKVTPDYSDGNWRVTDGHLTLSSGYGKYLFGSENWGDYVAEATITPVSDSINFGMVVRVSNPSSGGEGKDVTVGTDFLQGYFISLGNGTVVLGKQNYDWQELKRVNAGITVGQAYELRVEAVGATLRVYLDGKLIITYTDKNAPFLHGMAGFRSHDSTANIDQFSVKSVGAN